MSNCCANDSTSKFKNKVELDKSPIDILNSSKPKKNSLKEDVKVKSYTINISILEFILYNSFFRQCINQNIDGIKTESFGQVDGFMNIFHYGGNLAPTQPWCFKINIDGFFEKEIMFQTSKFKRGDGSIATIANISTKHSFNEDQLNYLYNYIRKIALNNSEYKGKCIKVSVIKGEMREIEVIDISDFDSDLILTELQKKHYESFVRRHIKGKNSRYLFDGIPGTGKTETIRKIIYELTPEWTFIIPDFAESNDLNMILSASEVFDKGVIIIDDIDLYLGTRDREKGTPKVLLADFLTFFDGVKKRKISLLASTNDKSLVDKAAERPGRFNFILDFDFLNDNQVIEVCKIHLPKQWNTPEIYEVLTGNDKNGDKMKITGAFISNLAFNIEEMSDDEENWGVDDTIELIHNSYLGFYSSQMHTRKRLGFSSGKE